jgi:hypothetical protein
MGVWRFEQLGGERRVLELADHAAPHGRPRQDPIVEDEIEIRENEVRYGGDEPPTRHLFGAAFTPWELNGRFSDWYGGQGFAKAKTEECRLFVSEQQQVLITWGETLSAVGLIRRFKPGRESVGEITWEMTILIDSDNYLGRLGKAEPPATPQSFTNRILLALTDLDELTEIPPTLTGGIFDALNSIISSINGIGAELNRAADQLDAFANAPFAALRRFRSGMAQLRTSLWKLRETYDGLTRDVALESRNAEQGQLFWDRQGGLGATMAQALSDIAKAERAATVAERGRIRGMVTAQTGDTWEKLALRLYGDASRAGEIREANGVSPGSPPVPGTAYLVPT